MYSRLPQSSGYCRRGKTFRVYAAGAPGEQGNSIVVKFNPVGKKDPYLDDVSVCVTRMINACASGDCESFSFSCEGLQGLPDSH